MHFSYGINRTYLYYCYYKEVPIRRLFGKPAELALQLTRVTSIKAALAFSLWKRHTAHFLLIILMAILRLRMPLKLGPSTKT